MKVKMDAWSEVYGRKEERKEGKDELNKKVNK